MSARRGFTLLELIVALTVTGIVALLVYGAASAAIDTERRLREHGTADRAERAWRAVLEDALRNLRSAADYQRPTLRIDSAQGPAGPRDRLWFITAGGTPPLTPDADWEVVVESVNGGVALTATPIGVVAPARRMVAPGGITGLDVRALAGTGGERWQHEWRAGYLPRAVALTYWSGGRALGRPTRLSLPLGATR